MELGEELGPGIGKHQKAAPLVSCAASFSVYFILASSCPFSPAHVHPDIPGFPSNQQKLSRETLSDGSIVSHVSAVVQSSLDREPGVFSASNGNRCEQKRNLLKDYRLGKQARTEEDKQLEIQPR